jgi:HTH-type transcriptional regulator/antitoxin HigA
MLEENNLSQADLNEIFGSQDIVSKVLNGKHSMSKSYALKLGEFFNLDPTLFLE